MKDVRKAWQKTKTVTIWIHLLWLMTLVILGLLSAGLAVPLSAFGGHSLAGQVWSRTVDSGYWLEFILQHNGWLTGLLVGVAMVWIVIWVVYVWMSARIVQRLTETTGDVRKFFWAYLRLGVLVFFLALLVTPLVTAGVVGQSLLILLWLVLWMTADAARVRLQQEQRRGSFGMFFRSLAWVFRRHPRLGVLYVSVVAAVLVVNWMGDSLVGVLGRAGGWAVFLGFLIQQIVVWVRWALRVYLWSVLVMVEPAPVATTVEHGEMDVAG